MSSESALHPAAPAATASPLAAGLARAAAWLERRGDAFWLVCLTALGALIYFPRLGAYPLWDPWEPHYSQVAWEMSERHTWVNPWYRGIDNWWSKPILMLWMLRASLGLLWDPAVDFDDNLVAARLPFALFAIAGGLLHYDWTRRLFGRAVGVLAAVVLLTAPQYVLLGRQVIVDIPFVATYAASLGYLAVGLFTPRPPLAAPDASVAQRARAWLAHHGPFLAFWSLQAVSMLAKGFVPPALALLVLAAYALVTFRWRDHPPVRGPGWARRVGVQAALCGVGLGLTGAAAWGLGRPGVPGLTGGLRALLPLHWQLLAATALLLAVGASLVWWRTAGGRRAAAWWLGVVCLAVAVLASFAAAFAPLAPRPANATEMQLYQVLALAAGATASLGALSALPPVRHALALLSRLRAGWGLVLFFAIGAPWFVYMTFEHGWPYWNEWLYYHHLGRAAGTIDKPGHTFNYFWLQLGAALFPWSAFLLPGLFVFVERCNPLQSVAARRNLFLLLCAAVPYLFFTLSGTKFAHYIFPVVPFAGVMIAAVLTWLGRGGAGPVALAEDGPALGPPVPADTTPVTPWWKEPAARGALFVLTSLALMALAVLAHDLVLDYRIFLRLFIYYANRATPPDYDPFVTLQVIVWAVGLVIASTWLTRWVGRWQLAGLGAGAVALAATISWQMLPRMGDTFSYGPFLPAYERLAEPGEEIGQYNDWQQPERSVIFLFQNRCKHLRNDSLAAAFLKRPGRKFIIVDQDRLADLRRVARGVGQTLTVVFDGHPYARLVSNQPSAEVAASTAEHVLAAAPPSMVPLPEGGADFEGKIRLLGYEISPAQARPGDALQVTFYYRCDAALDDDWQIFVHGDATVGGVPRLHADHFPLGGNHPTTAWKPGDIIRDRFEVTLPRDYKADRFILWTGWYRGDVRLKVTNAAPNDGDNRVRGPEVRVAAP